MSSTDATRRDRSQGIEYLKLVGLGAAIGVPAALLASVFLAATHWLETLLWDDLPDALGHDSAPWWLVLALPVTGAVVVVVARRFLPGDGGHSPLDGIGGGATPWQYAPGIALAAIGTLAFGAVLGPEAPLIALGSAVGMVFVSFVKVDEKARSVLATAGSFSAVSALFGGPLVAGMLLLEGGLAAGTALVPALLPGLTAAAVGYVLFVGLGDWGGIDSAALAVPDLPAYEGTRVVDLGLAIVVGVLASLLISQAKAVAHVVDRTARAGGDGRTYGALLLGGLAVGALALVVEASGADSHQLLFSGQSAVPDTLAETSVGLLVVIIAAKTIGYAVCLGCGFRGGPVFPAIFIGVALATIMSLLFDCSITWALAVGAGAGVAAGTGLVFSATLFAMLLTGTTGLDAMPATVMAVVAAWLTNAALRAHEGEPAAPGH